MTTYSDLNLLFSRHPITADVVRTTDESAIKAAVINLISTKNYERPFHPEIGSQIWGILFEPFSPDVINIMKQTIKDVLDKFEPRVTIKEVKIRDRVDNNEVEVEVHFIINNTDKLVKVTTALQRIR